MTLRLLDHNARESDESDQVGKSHKSVEAIGDEPYRIDVGNRTDKHEDEIDESVNLHCRLRMILKDISVFSDCL